MDDVKSSYEGHVHVRPLEDQTSILATLDTWLTCDLIFHRVFCGSFDMYRGFLDCYLITISMWSAMRCGRSESIMWCLKGRLCHLKLHGHALLTTWLGITSVRIHMWFCQKRERHTVALYVCLALDNNLNLVASWLVMYLVHTILVR